MQSQTKTHNNRGRNIVWGMWQRKPPMVVAGCSLLSFVSYRCCFSGAAVLALIICCSAIVLCSCELQCALPALPLPSYASTVRCYATLLSSPSSELSSLSPSSLSSVSPLSPSCPSSSFCSFFYLPRLLRSAERKERSSRLTSVRRQRAWHIPESFPCCLRWNLLWGDSFVWSWLHLSTQHVPSPHQAIYLHK